MSEIRLKTAGTLVKRPRNKKNKKKTGGEKISAGNLKTSEFEFQRLSEASGCG